MIIRISLRQLPMFFLCVGIFLFPSIIRTTISSSSYIEANYISLASLTSMYLLNRKKNKISLNGWNLFVYFFMFSSFGICTLYRKDYATCILYAATILIPIISLDFDFRDYSMFQKSIHMWIRFFDICVTFMMLCGLMDVFFKKSISNLFANLYQVESLLIAVENGRLVSYLGHPLLSSEIFIIYYVTRYLYTTQYLKKAEKLYPLLISVLGVAFTASKSGIVLWLAVFILFHANWRSRRYLPIALVVLAVLYGFGIFDAVMGRLTLGIQSNNLTTNRNTALESLLATGVVSFQWLTGQNIDYGWEMTAALEYPILRMAYQFGILFMFFWFLAIFVNPVIKLLRIKADKAFVFGIATIIVCVNTYNGLSLPRDQTLIYCVSILLLINMARYSRGES